MGRSESGKRKLDIAEGRTKDVIERVTKRAMLRASSSLGPRDQQPAEWRSALFFCEKG